MIPERLQKIIARAGITSRRKAEEFIVQGRVTVDGVVVSELGSKVDPAADIRLDGERIAVSKPIYLALNKPRGVICSTQPESGKPAVTDLLPHITQRLFCVGRLDADSCGLLLLTNDGELTQRLTHPSFEVPKTYEVKVRGKANEEAVARLRKGVYLAEGRVRCDRVELKRVGRVSSTLEIQIHQGINREIRRVLAKVGLPVSELKRTAIGPLQLGRLKLGHHRKLTDPEVRALYHTTTAASGAKPKRRRSLHPRRRKS